MSLDIIIILVIGAGLLFFLLFGIVVFIWWRRSDQPQPAAPQKKPVAKKRTASQQAAPKKAAPQDNKMKQPSASLPEPATSLTTAVDSQPATAPPTAPATPPPASPVPITGESGGDNIRVLIVDDNPDTRDNVSRLLYFEDNIEVIGQAINGRQGIEMSVELRPHIVLMDINMPDMDGITATEKMSVDSPYCQVIIMSVQAEQHYMKRAMAAGARDFQPKPFTADELINCILRVYEIGRPIYQKIEAAQQFQAQQAAAKPKKLQKDTDTPVVAVYSPKGGIGTSAVAANLAVALQQMQGDVSLMDGDLQFGDISVNLNVRPTRTMSDLIHADGFDPELLVDVVLAHDSGLKLLLSPSQPQFADTITPDMIPGMIKGLKNLFKVVVIDTTNQLTDVTLSILETAGHILLVTAPELPSIKSAKLFLELAAQLEYDPNKINVVINRSTLPGGVRSEQIAKVLKLQQQPYVIPYDSRLYMVSYKGALVNQQDPSAPSAQAIARIANDLWQKLAVVEEEFVPEVI